MTQQPHILVIEDDPEIRNLVRSYLDQNGFRCDAGSGASDLDRFITTYGSPDLIVLDLMLPGEDGLSICRRLRAVSRVPILMLTARTEEIDRIVGLEMGADDYLAKPFNPRELLARIRAILRRMEPAPLEKRRLHLAGLVIDLDARAVHRKNGRHSNESGRNGKVAVEGGDLSNNSAALDLTSAEFDLLECFVTRPGRVLSRDQLMDWTRGRTAEAYDRTIDVTMSRLRKKIEVGGDPLFKTIRNHGYMLSANVTEG